MVSTDKKSSCGHFASLNIKITNAIRRIYYIKSSHVWQIYLPIALPIKLTDSLDPDYILGAKKI